MKRNLPQLAIMCLASLTLNAAAATRYVDLNSPSPAPPHTSWASAARNIQDALDIAGTGDLVLVTNGVYATGGSVVTGPVTNRVAITKALTVRSVNGPSVTLIQGKHDTGDGNRARCAYLASGAILVGFTLTNGSAMTGDLAIDHVSGGGVRCADYSAVVSNCVLIANNAGMGGGAFGGTLVGCLLANNHGYYGGGAFQSVLNNCTVSGNTADYLFGGGGAGQSTLTNCIVYGNSPSNHSDSILSFCCTSPQPDTGEGNFTNNPAFADEGSANFRLQTNSPCINAGKIQHAPSGVDLDGHPRIIGGRVDVGAYESAYFKIPEIYYVDLNSPSPTPPYTNWFTAATNIQDAIDVATNGGLVLVTNGVYATGGKPVSGSLTNRAAIDKWLTLRSVNGPADTVIQGYQLPGSTNGDGAVRCVYLADGALLAGFTIAGGATHIDGDATQTYGGGIWCESRLAVVSNCVVVGNSAHSAGGGVFGGTLTACSVISNRVPAESWWGNGGGAYGSTLSKSTLHGNFAWYGGGANICDLDHCLISANWAWDVGGGADHCTLSRCTMVENIANGGGGTFGGTLNNCLVAKNLANWGGGTVSGSLENCSITGNSADEIGGAYCGLLNNCIVADNTAGSDPNYLFDGEFPGMMNYCCSAPLPTNGIGNFTNTPGFVDFTNGNYHLQADSPCINAGNNAHVTGGVDLDGNARLSGGTVDVGGYEFSSPASVLSYAWAQQYSVPTDGSADYLDTDGDGMNTWAEWRADTVPTNAASALLVRSVIKGGKYNRTLIVIWTSVPTRTYWLERSSDLGAVPPFQVIGTDIPGGEGSTIFSDDQRSSISMQPTFYRVGVQQ